MMISFYSQIAKKDRPFSLIHLSFICRSFDRNRYWSLCKRDFWLY